MMLLMTATGAAAALGSARARGRQDAPGSGHGARRPVQENLHEPARERQVHCDALHEPINNVRSPNETLTINWSTNRYKSNDLIISFPVSEISFSA